MEVLLLLFIFSGLLKGYFIFLGISSPIDLTVFFLLLILSKLSIDLVFKKNIVFPKSFIKSILFLLVFYLWMSFTLLYTPSKIYSFQKTGLFALNFIAFSLPLLIVDLNVKKFVKGFVLISIGCGIAYLPFQFFYQLGDVAETSSEMLEGIAGMYLDIGEYLGLSLLFCITSARLWKSNSIHFLVTITCLVVLVLIGARGPLLFALLLILLYFAYQMKRTLHYLFSLGFFVQILIGSLLFFIIYTKNAEYFDVLFERTVSRFMVLGENDTDNSSALTRISYIESSYEHIFKNPFVFILGNGVGSFGILILNEDIRAYPHNIILEVLFEFGFVGLLLFIAWIGLSIKFVRNKSKYISVLVLVYIFMNLLKSSSLVDIRLSFIVFSLYVLGSYTIDEKVKKESEIIH